MANTHLKHAVFMCILKARIFSYCLNWGLSLVSLYAMKRLLVIASPTPEGRETSPAGRSAIHREEGVLVIAVVLLCLSQGSKQAQEFGKTQGWKWHVGNLGQHKGGNGGVGQRRRGFKKVERISSRDEVLYSGSCSHTLWHPF